MRVTWHYSRVRVIVLVYAETTIQCACLSGYTGNGYVCTKDSSATNVCASSPCGPHGSCVSNENGTYSCECSTRYTGERYTY